MCAVAVRLRQSRIERPEHVEMHFERIAGIHVLMVATFPAERLAWKGGQSTDVDAAVDKYGSVIVGKVGADDSDQPGRLEETGRISEIGRRTTQSIIHRAVWRVDRIKGNRTDDQKGMACRHNTALQGYSGSI